MPFYFVCVFLLSEKKNIWSKAKVLTSACMLWWWRWKIWKKLPHKVIEMEKKYNTKSFGQIKLTHFKNVLIVIGQIILHCPRVEEQIKMVERVILEWRKEAIQIVGFVFMFSLPFLYKIVITSRPISSTSTQKKEAFPFQVKNTLYINLIFLNESKNVFKWVRHMTNVDMEEFMQKSVNFSVLIAWFLYIRWNDDGKKTIAKRQKLRRNIYFRRLCCCCWKTWLKIKRKKMQTRLLLQRVLRVMSKTRAQRTENI